MTVVYIFDERARRVLLRLKPGKIGKGKWNGPGGHVERESIAKNAERETEDESGLTPKNLTKCGIIYVTYEDKNSEFEIHFFWATEWSGKLLSGETLKWFSVDRKEIPYNGNMWKSDKHILPRFLEGTKCLGRFHYRGKDTLLRYKVVEVKELPERFDRNLFDF